MEIGASEADLSAEPPQPKRGATKRFFVSRLFIIAVFTTLIIIGVVLASLHIGRDQQDASTRAVESRESSEKIAALEKQIEQIKADKETLESQLQAFEKKATEKERQIESQVGPGPPPRIPYPRYQVPIESPPTPSFTFDELKRQLNEKTQSKCRICLETPIACQTTQAVFLDLQRNRL